ncbi:MAG: TfoX/Sxy family protein [Bacteroidales bacterium]
MAYNEFLADRIRFTLRRKKVVFEEKKMMGGLTFMVENKMCVGIFKEELLVRVDPETEENLLKKEGCKPLDFTRSSMKGFLMVEPEAIDMDEDLEFWIQLAIDFNPKAKASKPKNKKKQPK